MARSADREGSINSEQFYLCVELAKTGFRIPEGFSATTFQLRYLQGFIAAQTTEKGEVPSAEALNKEFIAISDLNHEQIMKRAKGEKPATAVDAKEGEGLDPTGAERKGRE